MVPAQQGDSSTYSPPEDAVDISPKQDKGVLKQIVKEGLPDGGKPATGDTVFVHYVGTLTDGKKFDSSRDRGDKFSFKLGTGSVIKAWDIGVATMTKGEVCNLICAPEYAYGEQGSGAAIPPKSTLLFEVELFSWKGDHNHILVLLLVKGEDLSKDQDGGIFRKVIKVGEGYTSPNSGSQIEVSLCGIHSGKVFDERELEFELGCGDEYGVVKGIETALKKFKGGEESLLTLSAKYAFGSQGNTEFSIPPDAEVEYKVKLKKFVKAKAAWEMDFEEKYEKAFAAKEKGTTFFKAGEFKKAASNYQKSVTLLDEGSDTMAEGVKEEENARRKTLLLAAYLNLAMCQLKLDTPENARESCEKALKIDSNSEKGLFRKGQSFMATKDWDLAAGDFQAVLSISPSNSSAKNQLALAHKKIQEERQKAKSTYAGMFDKFAAKDAMDEEPMGYQGEIVEWSNSMADGMMALPEELAMFGEQMPTARSSSRDDLDDSQQG